MNDFKFNEGFSHEPNIKELRDEFESLKLFVDSIKGLEGIDFVPIDDIPYNLGLELFFNSIKIAEIYCDEEEDRVIKNRYQAFFSVSNYERQELSLNECRQSLRECIEVIQQLP